MFFNYIFNGTTFSEEIIFVSVETISEVHTRYARCKALPKLDYKRIAINVLNMIYSSTGTYDKEVLRISKILQIDIGNPKFNLGFSIFTINLLIKRLAKFMKLSDRDKLAAPLNKDELNEIKFSKVRKISSVNSGNYLQLIRHARRFATGKIVGNIPTIKASSLYEWELFFWNNN